MLNLVQLAGPHQDRQAAIVDRDELHILGIYSSTYDLAQRALAAHLPMDQFARNVPVERVISYSEVYTQQSDWRLLPAFDHPHEPARCLVSGTGLTHKRSAATRESMHAVEQENDSIRMYRMGLDGGRPDGSEIGVAPEWFYKGDGGILRGHGDALTIPGFAEDGGEEPEIAGAYIIDAAGQPRRVGLMIGNEFSDHKFERRNYLYLAHSKLRECAIGPELVLGAAFSSLAGQVRIERRGQTIWQKEIASGEDHMCHSLANIEHHHFKYPQHRRPGDVHIHFFGADAFSFAAGVELQEGDMTEIAFPSLGRALRNKIRKDFNHHSRVTTLPV